MVTFCVETPHDNAQVQRFSRSTHRTRGYDLLQQNKAKSAKVKSAGGGIREKPGTRCQESFPHRIIQDVLNFFDTEL